jgi:hypothetical protein
MSWRLRDLGGEQLQRRGWAGDRLAPCAVRGLAAYKRPSVRAPWVSVSMTSAYRCGGRWSRSGALFEVTGVGVRCERARASVDH